MFGRGRFPWTPPKNTLQGLAALPPLIALTFACGAWEMLTNMNRPSTTVLAGIVVGGVVGMVAGMIITWMLMHFLAEQPKTEIDSSEEGTATDPDLYNVRDKDI